MLSLKKCSRRSQTVQKFSCAIPCQMVPHGFKFLKLFTIQTVQKLNRADFFARFQVVEFVESSNRAESAP